MLATNIALLLAIFHYFYPFAIDMQQNTTPLAHAVLIISPLFLLIQVLIFALSWNALEQAERNSTPHIMGMLTKDRLLLFSNLWIVLFVLLSYAIALDFLFFNIIHKKILLALWIVLLGITLDVLRQSLKRMTSYLNPFEIVGMFSDKGKDYVRNDKEIELCGTIDALTDISIKAIQRSGIGLTHEAMDRMQQLSKNFLEAQKSIGHPKEDKETKAYGIKDKVTYVLFFLYQRLELIYIQALEHRLEPINSGIISALGKIAIYDAKFDMSLVHYPLTLIGKLTKEAQEKKISSIPLKSTGTLLEVARQIASEIDLKYLEIKDPFMSIIAQLDDIAKETFRQEKNSNMRLLVHPFHELKTILSSEKLNDHPDTPVIVERLEGVMAEFNTLEMILRTIPPIPKISEENIK
jgi:hypothetical protein